MNYLCKKTCQFGTTLYEKGSIIPESVIAKNRIRTMITNGYIVSVNEVGETEQLVSKAEIKQLIIPIVKEEGSFELTINTDYVVNVLKVMQMNTEKAIQEINKIKEEDSLILIHALDSRKEIKDAAEVKATDLKEQKKNRKHAKKGDA